MKKLPIDSSPRDGRPPAREARNPYPDCRKQRITVASIPRSIEKFCEPIARPPRGSLDRSRPTQPPNRRLPEMSAAGALPRRHRARKAPRLSRLGLLGQARAGLWRPARQTLDSGPGARRARRATAPAACSPATARAIFSTRRFIAPDSRTSRTRRIATTASLLTNAYISAARSLRASGEQTAAVEELANCRPYFEARSRDSSAARGSRAGRHRHARVPRDAERRRQDSRLRGISLPPRRELRAAAAICRACSSPTIPASRIRSPAG